MKIKPVFTWSPAERKVRLFRVIWEREALAVIHYTTLEEREFVSKGHCGLCANRGWIDTRGIKTPAGFECGALLWCICPNGRTLKRKLKMPYPTDYWLWASSRRRHRMVPPPGGGG